MSDMRTRDESHEAHEGGCLCGAVRYRVTGPIDNVAHCHCRMCRRAAGAVALTFFSVPHARFAIVAGAPASYASSSHGRRQFCPICGTQLTFRSTRYPDDVDVTLASLDEADRYPADRNIWMSSKLPWLHLDDHLPGHPEFTPSG